MDTPFEIRLFDKAFTWVGVLSDPQAVTLNLRHLAQPTGQVVVKNDHRLLPRITTEGCRFTVDFQGEQVMSGLVDSLQGDGAPDGQVTLQLRDDYALLADVLGWQDPTATIPTSGASVTLGQNYWQRTGPAESVLKQVVQANAVSRLGLPVTVAADQGRGPTITVKWRMHPIGDRLMPQWPVTSGLGIAVRQVGAGLVVDCYQGRNYPVPITRESGIVTAWEWDWAAPTITRTVAGGQGEGTARKFLGYVDSTAEATWGIVRESFVDANDVDNDADLATRVKDGQSEGRRLTGLKLTLAETQTFRYGTHLKVGDIVTETLVGDYAAPHVLTECVLNWSVDDGFTATPAVGDLETHYGSRFYARALARTMKRLRELGTR